MKLKKFLVILIPLFAFMFLACGEDTFTGDEEYVNTEHGFKIVPPDGWVESSETYGSIVSFVSADGDKVEGGEPFYANLGVISENAQGLSFEEYLEASTQSTLDAIPGLEYIGQEKTQVDGVPAEIFISKFPFEGGTELVTIQLMTMKEGEAYIVTGASLDSAWGKNEKVLREALSSFTFEK